MSDIRKAPMLEDWQRPPEDPLQLPWLKYNSADGHLYLKSDHTVQSTTFPNDTPRYFYTEKATTGAQEIWAHPYGNAALQDGWELALVTDPLGARVGYEIVMWDSPLPFLWDLRKLTGGGGFTVLDSVTGPNLSPPYRVLLRLTETNVQTFYSADGGANWTMVNDVVDSAYRFEMYPSIGLTGVETAWGEIGAGPPNRSQIIRLPKN